jgi:hypothetical protein
MSDAATPPRDHLHSAQELSPFAPMALWLRLLWIIRMLWTCRVSVLSAIAGLWLFNAVPQAQDLFADISYGALPDSPRGWLHWASFFLWVFLIWAFPVHYAARRMLASEGWMTPWRLRHRADAEREKACVAEISTDVRKKYAREILWIPRLLGVTPFLAVAVGLISAESIVKKTLAFDPSASAYRQIMTLYVCDLVTLLLFAWFILKRRRLAEAIPGMARKLVKGANASDDETILRGLLIVSLIGSTLLYVGAYVCPFLPAETAPRALVVPFLFGSLVLFASLLAQLGLKSGFPVLEAAIALAIWTTSLNDRFNDLRTLTEKSPNISARQIDIEAAIDKWKVANHCASGQCPPALIVAAEGGASRAAFAAATALGYLLDQSDKLPDASILPAAPARRVFAISGVSGGAFGAATIRTALWESQNRRQSAPPCLAAPRGWLAPPDLAVTQSWRGCLQALVAGDYLTPAFVGVAFRDNVAPRVFIWGGPSILHDDRAALVERAWEYHFAHVVREADASPLTTIFDDFKPEAGARDDGLRRPFGYVSSDPDGSWTPLLLLNGTSVNSGARIIASDLVSTVRAKSGQSRDPLYSAAYDLFEMLSKPCPNDQIHGASCETASRGGDDVPARRDGVDVRLSTAAMLSARFPIVSPAGTIRAKNEDEIGDRVVDGGYFENAGLTTALDVARALRRFGLTPVVLWVQNDPTVGDGDPEDKNQLPDFPPRAASTPRLGESEATGLERVLGTVATPFHALVSTRAGHALEAATAGQVALQSMNAATAPSGKDAVTASYFTFKLFRLPRFKADASDVGVRPDAQLDVYCKRLMELDGEKRPVMSEVSMSWWLSQSVQAELDSQICDWRNRRSMGDLIKRLSQSLPVKPD